MDVTEIPDELVYALVMTSENMSQVRASIERTKTMNQLTDFIKYQMNYWFLGENL